MIDFILLKHEYDVRNFANFIANRGMKLIAITSSISEPTALAVWFEGVDAETNAKHREEFFSIARITNA